MAACIVCTQLTDKYKCPKCFETYCSVECYKQHKESPQCVVKQEVQDTEQISNENEPTIHEPFKTEDTVSRDKLLQLVPTDNEKAKSIKNESPKKPPEDSKIRKTRQRQRVRKHRKNVAKFEQIYGPIGDILASPSKFPVPERAMRVNQSLYKDPGKMSIKNCTHIKKSDSNHVTETLASSEPAIQVIQKDAGKISVKRSRSENGISANGSMDLECNLLRAAVIDRTHPDGELSADIWHSLQDLILDEIAKGNKDNSDKMLFNGADLCNGVRVVNCRNKKTFDFLKSVIEKCSDLYPGAKLDVIYASDLPLRNAVTVWIPPPVKSVETILKILANQNVNLDTSQWQHIISLPVSENKGIDCRLLVDQESLRTLRKMEGIVAYGLGHVGFCLRNLKHPKRI